MDRVDDIYIALSEEEKLRIPYNAWYKTYMEEIGPTKTRQTYVADDKKHYAQPKRPRPHRALRHKMTDIEKKRRKIELDLAKIDARRKAWRDINNVV